MTDKPTKYGRCFHTGFPLGENGRCFRLHSITELTMKLRCPIQHGSKRKLK